MEEINQAEKVKRSQLAIAQSMQISEDALKVLDSVQEWTVREWLYVCALDGIDLKEMTNTKGRLTVDQIKEKRTEYLTEKLSHSQADKKVIHDFEKLQKDVRNACEESRKVRDAVTDMIRSNEVQVQALDQKKIKEKDDIIADLQNRNRELERKLCQSQNKTEETGPRKKTSSVFAFFKRSGEVKKFIEKYLQDDRYSSEQIEFLLECIESGMRVREIEKIAIPGVSIEVMKRLKNL